MIIPSKLIKLDYNPATDVLFVEWPDVHDHSLHEVNEILAELLRTIRHYDVKRLLIDSRATLVTISQAEYAHMAQNFGKQLLTTRLEKLARLESIDAMREAQVKEISKQNHTPIALKNFTDLKAAFRWLEEGLMR